jgi:hypothetical protein
LFIHYHLRVGPAVLHGNAERNAGLNYCRGNLRGEHRKNTDPTVSYCRGNICTDNTKKTLVSVIVVGTFVCEEAVTQFRFLQDSPEFSLEPDFFKFFLDLASVKNF